MNDKEQMKLCEMVYNRMNRKYNVEWKLLIRASRDGFRDEYNYIADIVLLQQILFVVYAFY